MVQQRRDDHTDAAKYPTRKLQSCTWKQETQRMKGHLYTLPRKRAMQESYELCLTMERVWTCVTGRQGRPLDLAIDNERRLTERVFERV